jgi:hypothetical protein
VPPRPVPPSAATEAPSAIARFRARGIGPVPETSPPIRTRPPASPPLAATRAPAPISTRLPVTAISPPRRVPEASSVPPIRTAPPAVSSIPPPVATAPPARTTPDMLMTPSSAAEAAPAESTTRPSPTSIRPACSIRAPRSPPSTAIRAMPSPARSSVVRSPEASTTVPWRATMTPRFSTSRPTRAPSPAAPMVIAPSLTTRAPAMPPPSIRKASPRRKEAGSTRPAVATRPPTSMRASRVKRTPASFCTITVPGAVILPAISLARPPVTRLSVADPLPGWRKSTLWSRPTSKRRQSITARSLSCRTTVLLPRASMVAAPWRTCPPSGACARACGAAARRAARAQPSGIRRERQAIVGSTQL